MAKILSIDDNKFNLLSLKTIINDSFPGSTLYSAIDGAKGIELAIASDPDVILLDIIMPGIDGFEVCRRLKQDENVCDIPVVFLTALKADKEFRIKAVEIGAEAFLSKPIDPTELTVQIRAMVKIKLANRQKRDEKERLTMLVAERTHELEQSQIATLNLVSELKAENESHRKTEEQLQESETHFRTLADSGQALIWTSGLDKKCDYFNQTWLNFTGRTLDQELGDGWLEGVHPDDLQQCIDIYVSSFNHREKFSMEYRIFHSNGEYRWIQDDGTPRNNSKGEFIGYIGHCLDITGRKQAEEALKASEIRYRSLFKSAKDGILILDAYTAQIVDVNPYMIEMLGYSHEEFLGKKLWEIGPFKDILESKDSFEELQRNGYIRYYDLPIKTTGGRVINVEFVSNVYLVNQIKVIQCNIRNITERKLAEEAINLSEARLRRAELASNSGNWEFHLDSKKMNASEGAIKLYGLDKDHFDYAAIKKIPFTKNRAVLNSALKNLIEKEEPYDVEFKIKKADTGEIKDIHSVAKYDKEKKILFGIVHDITDRKQTEEKIKKSEANLSSLINNRDESIWSIDNNYNIIIFNNFVRDEYFASFNIELKKGMNVLNILSPQWREFWQPKYDKALSGRRIIFEYSNQVGNEIHWYEVFLNPIISDGKITGVSALSAVITKRKKAEQALRESEAKLHELNATKDKFFSIIAHDLKSPFNAIIGFSEMLAEEVQGKNYENIGQYAAIIEDSSKRAMDLLMNLMEWSRSQTGRMEFNPETIDIVGLINDVTALLDDSAKQKSITIYKKTPDNLAVFADKAMTGTILRNLISNAIKFTQANGQVAISVQQKMTELIVSVQDSGVGIKKEAIEKLFRIDENHSTLGTQNETGTGLGLILCKEFVEKHGGKIWVESEVGKGSKFVFAIPKI